MAEEEEVAMEVEAVQAVYGDDCIILDRYPPHLYLHVKPRTADNSSQQFVEAVIVIRAGPKYPKEPPFISLIDSKGLDEGRQKHLINCIKDKALELSSCLMLVEICEEAFEKLTFMNHPDGDCPLCLYPLVSEGCQCKGLPFMKLMSCFHCFHSECIIRWWKWLHMQKETEPRNSSMETTHPYRDMGRIEGFSGMDGLANKSLGSCPVCRKVFDAKDLKHVLDLVGAHSSQLEGDATEGDEKEKLLQSDSEDVRRERFESILKLQQEKGGLIEPKKNITIMPGIFLPQPVASTKETTEQEEQDQTSTSGFSNKAGSSQQQRGRGPRRPDRHWVQKKQG